MSELRTIADLFTRAEFLSGLVLGAMGVAVLFLFGARRESGGWAIALTGAASVAIAMTVGGAGSLLVGLILLALSGLVFDWTGAGEKSVRYGLALVLAVAGAAVVGRDLTGNPSWWIPFAAPLVIIFIAWCLSRWQTLGIQNHLGLVVLITTFGIWATVPETNVARALLGAAAALAAATYSPVKARITSAGAGMLAGLMIWIGASGGAARPGSIIGAWACMGLLVLAPVLRSRLLRLPTSLLLVAHGLWVLLAARVFGFFRSAVPAAIGIGAMGLVVLMIVLLVPTERLSSTAYGPE